eukprot:gnl/MRDRNA2_/MRDRNA2_81849_c0_seq2.p1 gnl/MRDRNA2_/MRDRNA2_81849_c0~~gnl/MRDRNA2_/MRDRNA2_81849_c0_seq2.p1  ORF type:complete len:379 (+),score=59.33 gnl/MRDRNA2_/MRDRNA2_81849_c0_seq2:49-1185(+)
MIKARSVDEDCDFSEARTWWRTQRWCRSTACHNVCRLLAAQKTGNIVLSRLPEGVLSRNITDFLQPGACVVAGLDDGRAVCIDAGDGSLLWSIDLDIKPKLWSYRGRSMTAHVAVSSIVVLPGRQQVVIGSDDGHVRFVDADTGNVLHDVEVANSALRLAHMITHDEGTIIAAGSDEGEICFLEAQDGSVIKIVEMLPPVRSLVFSMSRELLIAGCGDGQLRLFTTSGNALDSVQLGSGMCSLWSVVLLSSGTDDHAVAMGSDTGDVFVYDFDLGQGIAHSVATQPVVSVAALPCGQTIVAGSLDDHVRFLQIHDGTVTTEVSFPVTCILVLSKVSGIVLGASDGFVTFFKVDSMMVTKPACTIRFSPNAMVNCMAEM